MPTNVVTLEYDPGREDKDFSLWRAFSCKAKEAPRQGQTEDDMVNITWLDRGWGNSGLKDKSVLQDVTKKNSFNEIGKITLTDAGKEGSVNDIGKITVTDADEEGRYDDLNLPDSPFAFEDSVYAFAWHMGRREEWDLDDEEL